MLEMRDDAKLARAFLLDVKRQIPIAPSSLAKVALSPSLARTPPLSSPILLQTFFSSLSPSDPTFDLLL